MTGLRSQRSMKRGSTPHPLPVSHASKKASATSVIDVVPGIMMVSSVSEWRLQCAGLNRHEAEDESSLRCDLNSYGDECLVKGADRSSHRTYPTRQSGEVTSCSGTLGQWTPLARVASEPRGNGASASSEAEVGLGCMDSMVSICKLLQAS
jgi:hypothetical protein